jgi:hypothetical protein
VVGEVIPNPDLFQRFALILEIKDSSAGCGLGCPDSDEEYPRRESSSEGTAVVATRPAPKGPANRPDDPATARQGQ